jgi:hypothetical protein
MNRLTVCEFANFSRRPQFSGWNGQSRLSAAASVALDLGLDADRWNREPQSLRQWIWHRQGSPKTAGSGVSVRRSLRVRAWRISWGRQLTEIIGQTVQRVISTGNEQVAVQNQTGKRSATDARKPWNAAAATLSL